MIDWKGSFEATSKMANFLPHLIFFFLIFGGKKNTSM